MEYQQTYHFTVSSEEMIYINEAIVIEKVIDLDLDNTLWGGVIGDDGAEGIAIGQETAQGEAFTWRKARTP